MTCRVNLSDIDTACNETTSLNFLGFSLATEAKNKVPHMYCKKYLNRTQKIKT